MLNDCEELEQPLALAVTVMVATKGALVVLVAVNGGIFPLPLATRPIDVRLLTHE
jgi:hypothetical protein